MPKPLYRSSIQLEFKMTASKTWFIIEVFSSNIMPARQASILAPIAMKERLHEISLPCTHSLTVPNVVSFCNLLSLFCLFRVIDGLETLDDLEKLPVNEKTYRPLTEVRIKSVTIHANPIADHRS